MQALPISSEPSQFATSAANHASSPSSAANATDSSGLPVFARIVHEVLARNDSDARNPSVRPSKTETSPSAKKIPPSTNAKPAATSPQTFAVSAALVIPISALPAPPALPASFEPSTPSGASQHIPASATPDTKTNDASNNPPDWQPASNFSAPLTQPPLAALQAALAPISLPLLATPTPRNKMMIRSNQRWTEIMRRSRA